MARANIKLIGLSLALLVLAGCGSSPTTPKRTKSHTQLTDAVSAPGAMVPGLAPGAGLPGQPAGPGAEEGAFLLQAARTIITQINGFDATIRSYSQGNYKSGERVSELRKSTTEARLIWVKPSKLRCEVIKTTNPIIEGAALATTDMQNVTARAKGLLGLIPFHLQVNDPKLGNNRNHRLPQNQPKAQIDRLTSASAVWTVIGEDVVEGTPCKVIQIDNTARLDKAITRETIDWDPAANTLRRVVMYAGNTRVVDHTLTKFKWNPKVSASSFQL